MFCTLFIFSNLQITHIFQITTIRRYGGNTTRSKIPIGTFYGHTFILPWERERFLPALGADNTSDRASSNQPTSLAASDHSQILAQLGIYSSLLEEVQCRYNLACRNLTHLLSNVDSINTGSNHFSNFFLKKGKRTEDDNKIYQAYYECIQLQVIHYLTELCLKMECLILCRCIIFEYKKH